MLKKKIIKAIKVKKLVRDNVPEILEAEGKKIETHIAEDKEYEKLLHNKLQEEVKEFLQGEKEEKFADILEVLETISDTHNFNRDNVRMIKARKAREEGRYLQRIVLDKVK